jgi:hypothetical protein
LVEQTYFECGITISINPSVMGETVAKIINN